MLASFDRTLTSFAAVLLLCAACSGPSADNTAKQEQPADDASYNNTDRPIMAAQHETLNVAFDPAKLLWYDGTSVGEALSPQRGKAMRTLTASSTLPGYPVKNLRDQDPATAWCEGVGGAGAGQSIQVRFVEGQTPGGMLLIPGYAKSAKIWARNPRVESLLVRFLPSPEAIAEARVEGTPVQQREYLVELLTASGEPAGEISGPIPFARPQYVDFRPPFTQDMSMLDFDGLELSILDVETAGAVDEDTCISELRFYDW